jgi:hypothetical protein
VHQMQEEPMRVRAFLVPTGRECERPARQSEV